MELQRASDVAERAAEISGKVSYFTSVSAVFAGITLNDVAIHDEGFLVADIKHQGGNGDFAEHPESLEPAFAANQQIAYLAVRAWTRRDGDGLLEADGLDVADYLVEDAMIPLARIEDIYTFDRNLP